MARKEVRILEGARVARATKERVELEDGRVLEPDVVFLALGVRPSPLFRGSGLPTGLDGGLLVNAALQSVEYPEIFGGGDCIWFRPRPLAKVGVYAVRENMALADNLLACLEGRDPAPFDPGGDYLLIYNTGGGRAVLRKSWLTLSGRLAFRIKDYIDRRFMRAFKPEDEGGRG